MLNYPESPDQRNAWIEAKRPARNALDPFVPYAFFNELERVANGELAVISTLFLTNRECPWRCLMCDLWKNTLTLRTPVGAIPAQIRYALSRLEPATEIKLYNSGSFFDNGAIPITDYAAIANQVDQFRNVIVESHPSLIGADTLRFRDLLTGRLEVAMGLETVHEDVLARLNKRMTLEQYRSAADKLSSEGIATRAFILVRPPFMTEDEALYWACRSIDFAFDCGASAVSLIPVRAGNGAMETLQKMGEFAPPSLTTLRKALKYGLSLGRGRVFADLWDIDAEDLKRMNLEQRAIESTDARL